MNRPCVAKDATFTIRDPANPLLLGVQVIYKVCRRFVGVIQHPLHHRNMLGEWRCYGVRVNAELVTESAPPVPYFLLCRAIELELKATHLVEKPKEVVKKEFGHNLEKSYANIPAKHRLLSSTEERLLAQVSAIYAAKDFEYFNEAAQPASVMPKGISQIGHQFTSLAHNDYAPL